MSWINLPSVTISNGSKTLTINGGSSTANINAGDGIQIGAFELYEVAGVYANQLTLVKSWGNATQTNAVALVVPTFGDFNSASEALRTATQNLRDNYSALETWGTQTGDVLFTGKDGQTHSARTLKQMDADAQQVQDDLTANIDANMVTKIAEVSPANIDWDVDIPFNEGLEMTRGFGNRDAYGNRAVDFSRASTQLYVNKSGEVQRAEVDEPCIQKDGVLVTGSATGLSSHSLDLTQGNWVGSATSTAYPSEDVGVLTPVVVIPQAVEAIHSGPTQVDEFASTGWYQQTYIIKAKELGVVQVGSNVTLSPTAGYQLCKVDFRDGTILSGGAYITQLERISNDFWILSHKFQTGVVMSSRRIFQIYSNDYEQTWTPNGTDGILLAYSQLTYAGTEEPFAAPPLIETGSVSASVAATIPRIPIRNNLPAVGQPFSLIMDTAIPLTDGSTSAYLFRADAKFRLVRNIDNNLRFVGLEGILVGPAFDANKHRFVLTFDGENITIYIDGEVSINGSKTIDYDMANPIYIGVNASGQFLNGTVGNFRIVDRALTQEEVSALGAAV